jgi:hypothetical protein
MNNRMQVAAIARSLGYSSVPDDWTGVDIIMPVLEQMRLEGAIVLIKLDGERTADDNGPYTAIVTGAILNGHFSRTDGHSIEDALAHVIVGYACLKWNWSNPQGA